MTTDNHKMSAERGSDLREVLAELHLTDCLKHQVNNGQSFQSILQASAVPVKSSAKCITSKKSSRGMTFGLAWLNDTDCWK